MKKRGKYTYSDILFGNGSTVSLVSTFILFLPVFLQLIWQIQNQGLPISDQGNLYNSAFEIYFKFKIGLKEGIHFIFHDSGRPILFSAFAAPLIPLSFIDENLPIIAFITIVQSITCISYYLIFSSRIGKIKSALLAGLITTSPYIYNLHNLFTSEILWHMFFAISLYFLLNLFKTNKTYYQISAGTCLAFCALARPIESLILLSPIIIIYFFLLHKEKNLNLNVLILNFSISTILLVSSSIVNWFKINQFVGLSFLILVNILFIFRNYFFKQFDNKKTLKNNLNLKSSYSYFFLCISNIISIWIFFYFRALYLWAYGNSFGNAAKVTDQINLSKSIFAIIYEVFSVYGLIILSSSSFFALIIIFYRRQQGIKEIKFLIYSTVTIFLTIVPMTLLYSTTGTSDSRRIMIGISLFSLIILFYIGKEIIINKFLSIFIWLTFSILFLKTISLVSKLLSPSYLKV